MKKPSVSNSKKGVIFNILWILIENPLNLEYIKVNDISNILADEFSINVDRKTIMDNIEVLNDLNLWFNIEHVKNKGYRVINNLLTDSERNQLISLIESQRNFDDSLKAKLIDYCSFDISSSDRKKNIIDNRFDVTYDIISTISTLNKAIEEKKNITFEYLNYDSFAKFHNNNRVYDIYPQYIHFHNGQYYLYASTNVWPTEYCGIRIRYMQNIKIGDKSSENIEINPLIFYKITFKIKYEWAIEYFPSFFTDYKIYTSKEGIFADVCAPFDYIAMFYKTYGFFFEITDEYLIKETIDHANLLLDNLNSNNPIQARIKRAVVSHYFNSSNSNLDSYLISLEKTINNELSYIKSDKKIEYKIVVEENIKDIKNILNDLSSESDKYLIVLYNNISLENINLIKEYVSDNKVCNELDQFSYVNPNLYHRYSVLHVK